MSTESTPPSAARRPRAVESPHGGRVDEYYWLRDDTRTDPEVLAHLAAENAYKDHVMAPLAALEARLYEEIVARIRQDDSSVPYRDRGYWYYQRFDAGREYPLHARRPRSLSAPEEVMLDLEELARGHDYYDVAALEVSPDTRMLAYAEDTVGRRQYTLRFRDLVTGEVLADTVPNVEPSIAWAADSRAILYVEKDPETLLGNKVRCHRLGMDPAADALVYEERDDAYFTDVGRSKDGRFLYILSHGTVTSEQRYADATDAALDFRILLPREREHEYQAEHCDGRWVIRTNWQSPNFRLVEAPIDRPADRACWKNVVPHRPDVFVHDFDVFRDFLAIEERSGGLRKVRIHPWSGAPEFCLGADEPAYRAVLGDNEEFASEVVRYVYTSLTTPPTTWDYDVRTGERTLLKQDPVLGDFDPTRYVTEYLRAPARDGETVPIAVVYRKGYRRDGTAPLLQYGYGAYGLSSDPGFSSALLSLLDRGFVYAIAQVRGGQELGRRWYDAGRLHDKANSFTDFIDATRFLVKEGLADAARVFARGGSAGGLLVGAVANLAPREYKAIVAHVPFVDVVTTMLDESLPLTTNEYDEWGDPNERAHYDYMLSYSPYDNVRPQDYPAMFVTTGLWDSQVQYFEPAKWVARLRQHNTGRNPILLRVNMEAGHGGKSGRFRRYRELAEEYAFLLGQAGITS